MQEKKPWWQSKIFLLSIVIALTGVSDLTFGWLPGQGVTPEQVEVIAQTLPAAAENVKDAAEANNWFGIITAVGGFLTGIWRKWFTTAGIK